MIRNVYQTEDGKIFDDQSQAIQHEIDCKYVHKIYKHTSKCHFDLLDLLRLSEKLIPLLWQYRQDSGMPPVDPEMTIEESAALPPMPAESEKDDDLSL